MTRKSERANGGTSRRNFLAVTGVAGAAALAGCSGSSGDSKDSSTSSGGDGSDTSNDDSDKTSEQSGDTKSKDLLTAGGSSTVYPITNDAASLWNYNAPADDEEYWPHSKYNIDTKKNFADYWASQYDVPTNSDKGLPFHVSVGLSHSGVGLNKVKEGKTDIGDASAPVQAELSGLDSYDKFKNHVVGIDAMQVVVSKDIKDSGVNQITIEDLAKVYRGKITNWSKLGVRTAKFRSSVVSKGRVPNHLPRERPRREEGSGRCPGAQGREPASRLHGGWLQQRHRLRRLRVRQRQNARAPPQSR